MEGKVITITGGASGIGLAVVKALLSRGAKVSIADISSKSLDAAIKELGTTENVTTTVCDVTQLSSVKRWLQKILDTFGQLDGAVNNAGKIPEKLDSANAAPMLCGGLTVFSTLKQYECGPGKTVGVVGVGGLGHFAVLFAKAMGVDKVVAISRKANKKEDAAKLGADEYVATDEDEGWEVKYRRSLDLIISTVSSEKMPITSYLMMLKRRGTLVQVGNPDGGNLPPINAFPSIVNGVKISGSAIGSPHEMVEVLQFAAEKGIKPWTIKRSMAEANSVIQDMAASNARYRYVLENEKHL
ncbi:hypothetical protein ACMFMG_010283 [Clarireedia jacksonii]